MAREDAKKAFEERMAEKIAAIRVVQAKAEEYERLIADSRPDRAQVVLYLKEVFDLLHDVREKHGNALTYRDKGDLVQAVGPLILRMEMYDITVEEVKEAQLPYRHPSGRRTAQRVFGQ